MLAGPEPEEPELDGKAPAAPLVALIARRRQRDGSRGCLEFRVMRLL
jgi:hypothetical protein